MTKAAKKYKNTAYIQVLNGVITKWQYIQMMQLFSLHDNAVLRDLKIDRSVDEQVLWVLLWLWLNCIQYRMSSASYVPKLAYPHTESMLRRFMALFRV